ncbi:MAG: sulfatase [bacterium]
MDRRRFVQTTGLGAAGIAAGRRVSASRKPNIVIIMADDLGYGDLGCYGSEAIKTPVLDRMADEGAKLTSFYSSGPVCTPSRAGLITGRYPIRTGAHDVFFPDCNPLVSLPIHLSRGLGPGMSRNEITLAQALKQGGYATCCIGKWHLGDLKSYRPHHRGFDHYMGLLYSNDMVPLPLYRNDEIIDPPPANQDLLTQKYTSEALSWIKQNKDRPFFLYLPHTFPHIPLHASEEFRGTSEAGRYGDCIEEIDWSTGEIMDALERYGLSENTFVFFTSDNGPWYQGSTGRRRGRKGETFDGGMRVPAIARWPGKIPAGSVTDQMSMNFDLFTTALAVAGLNPPQDRPMDGKNIMPLLQGEDSPHKALYFYNSKDLQAVRTQNWKYRRRHAGYATNYWMVPKGPMLFDLTSDHDESYNVIDLYPDKAREMEELMKSFEKNLVKGVPGELF